MYTAQLVTNSKINSAPFFIANHFTFEIVTHSSDKTTNLRK